MKAILRLGASLLGLLLLVSASHGYYWVSPVFKQPYPVAPSPSNSGFYLMDAYGRWTGPHYYLVPPHGPFNGILPGPTGQAIMSGNLPHELLLSKQGMTLGNVPLLGKKQPQPEPEGSGQGGPPMGGAPHMMPNPMAGGGGMMPYPLAGGGMMPNPSMQTPYGYLPTTPYALQPPYVPPMQMMPRPTMPQGTYAPHPPMMQPIGYVPYYGPPGMYATAQRDPRTGIWQVQNVMPGQSPSPFAPIPNFTSGMPGMPMQNPPMMMPMMPNMNMAPFNGMQPFGPLQPLDPLNPLQGPQMNFQPLQLPRMDMAAPPPQRPASGYPTHPFTRSPRDFFMWGENMDDERARGSRPFPVP